MTTDARSLRGTDCPHAAPHRYCNGCQASPCPIGLDRSLDQLERTPAPQPAKQKASIGRIVHVLVSAESNNGADVAPAIITRAWSDDVVNLRVLADSDDTPRLTSVPLLADEEAAHSLRRERLATQLTHTAVAFWPGRS